MDKGATTTRREPSGLGWAVRADLATLLVAVNLAVVTGIDALSSPAGAAPGDLGPIAPPGRRDED